MLRKMSLIKAKEELKDVFLAGVKSVQPHEIIRNKIRIDRNNLFVDNKSYAIRERIHMVGFGKGVMGMAIAMEKLLGDRLMKGIISIPRGAKSQIWDAESIETFSKFTGVISYQENSINNHPDSDTLTTTSNIINMVEALGDNDTLIVLISGGGSALLSMPRFNVSADDKLNLCKKLFNLGANIKEVNAIRQKLSIIKAGGLARIAYPANIIGLILSDIIEDPVELIASGPTVYSPKSPEDVIRILNKYEIFDEIDGEMKKILISQELNNDESFLDKQQLFTHVQNIIIGNNSLAIEAAQSESLRKNLNPIVLFNNVQGVVSDVSTMYGKICYLICQVLMKSLSKDDFISSIKADSHLSVLTEQLDKIYNTLQDSSDQGFILIAGGEPTVTVSGTGKDGRNQELALRFSLDWFKIVEDHPQLTKCNVVFLSAGTDGQDGPTDAAGAFGYSDINSTVLKFYHAINSEYKATISENNNPTIRQNIEGMIPENVLRNNDSYTFYSRFNNGSDLLKTGITGTNVMDLHLIYIKKFDCTCRHDIDKNETISEDNFFIDFFKNSE
ncbi:hypothetical protein PV327_001665 [Microctonus hyperodae]|uniref:Glycerate kinase n=1 Tax=Microctonus hyperodae TaxID=165561 RepID=A0AA39FDY6_MICHY|nr:hypothetical protein PV327_001665 [Microctonus hyperodae]